MANNLETRLKGGELHQAVPLRGLPGLRNLLASLRWGGIKDENRSSILPTGLPTGRASVTLDTNRKFRKMQVFGLGRTS